MGLTGGRFDQAPLTSVRFAGSGWGRSYPGGLTGMGKEPKWLRSLSLAPLPLRRAAHTWTGPCDTGITPLECQVVTAPAASLRKSLCKHVVASVVGPCCRYLIGRGSNNSNNGCSTGKDGFHADARGWHKVLSGGGTKYCQGVAQRVLPCLCSVPRKPYPDPPFFGLDPNSFGRKVVEAQVGCHLCLVPWGIESADVRDPDRLPAIDVKDLSLSL